MKIAVEGCSHGALDAIYRHLRDLETRHNYLVDVLLMCGDFQAIRNHRDMQCMAVPQKYRQLGDFHKYYTGENKAPVLTIVIGGNHEASNYMSELYHGGWLAPNIYFLGHAGCVQVNGIRIAGASGIFKRNDFSLGLYERLPYDHGSMRSIYHIREYNIRRLSLLSFPDIFLSHDWPQHIEKHGDTQGLLRRKPFFRQDIETGNLGSPPLMGLLQTLQPQWWFSAHLHVRFQATVQHVRSATEPGVAPIDPQSHNPDEITIGDDFDSELPNSSTEDGPHVQAISQNPDEIILEEEEKEVAQAPLVTYHPKPSVTKFLALDKCLPKREFMEVVDVPTVSDESFISGQRSIPRFTFDPEWLAITRAFHPHLSTKRRQADYPDEETARANVAQEMEWVKANIGERPILDCQTFVRTAPVPESEGSQGNHQPPWYTNPQTVAFCDMLGIENKIDFSIDNRA